MSENAQDLKLKLTTQGDTRGSDAVASSVDRVVKTATRANAQAKDTADANRKVGDSSKDAAKGLLDQGEAMGQAAAGGRVLTEVSQGNIAALLQVGSVLKALKVTLSSTLGVVGVVLAAAAFAIGKVQEKLAEKKENQLRLEAEKTEIAFNAAREAADKLNGQKTDAFQARLKAIDDTARLAVERVQRLVDIAAKLDDVERATQLADIDADQSLTAEQKLDAKAGVNRTFAGRAEARQRQLEDAAVSAAQAKFDDTLRATADAARVAKDASARSKATNGFTIVDQMKPLERQLAEAQAANPGANVRIPELEDLQTRLDATKTPSGQERAAQAAAEAAARAADLKAVREREVAAKQALRELQERIADERNGRAQLAALQAKQDKRQYNLDLNEARKIDEAKAPRRGPVPEPLPAAPARVTDGSDESPVPQPTEDDRTRNRLGGLANVANAQAEQAANDPRLGDAMRELAKQAAAATKAAEGDQSAATLQEAIRLMLDLATGLAAVKTAQAEEARKTAEQMATLKGKVDSVRR